jgi:hypothetical protein
MDQFDLKRLCDKHISGGNTFIIRYFTGEIFGFAHIRKSGFLLEKIHNFFSVTRFKERDRKFVYQSVQGKRVLYRIFQQDCIAVLV